jgi:hypothetical protein
MPLGFLSGLMGLAPPALLIARVSDKSIPLSPDATTKPVEFSPPEHFVDSLSPQVLTPLDRPRQ